METTNFLAWVLLIGGVGTFGLWVMLWAYRGSGSRAVVFGDPIDLPPPTVETEEYETLKAGLVRFREGAFSQAIAQFSKAILLDTQFAEAYHNQGLTQANLRQDGDAVRSLVKAGELYLEQGNPAGYERVKADLQQLKSARSTESSPKSS
ncbi:hypothetical protein ACQ4M4_01340 [Leptolyngbya sp. AN02str]|uniref:hypothetical protein n=1 Tax=Leptolyngbya sp. AN02str TaxID=3423363 RepID=UPI003D31CD40